jgi:REP element-mobilizing transposase RayT
MTIPYPERKLQRLTEYDYSSNGAYFVTICTKERRYLFGCMTNDVIMLNEAGSMVMQRLENISDGIIVTTEKYIVMPNHVHAIIVIHHNETHDSGTARGPFPTLSEYIRRFKTITTKLYIDGVKEGMYAPFNKAIWQKSFHDRILRDENEYLQAWKYIDENPLKWALDEYNL